MKYYFAYGSNMEQNQMRERCPDAILLGLASLTGYRLAFTIYSPKRLCGCADIVKSDGSEVYGLLYELTDEEMLIMDSFEGHPIHYQRTSIEVKIEGEKLTAHSYEVVNKQYNLKPSKHYLALLQNAASLNNFPEKYQAFLHSFTTI